MSQHELIEYANSLSPLDKLRVYMDYYCNMLYIKYACSYYDYFGRDKWKAKTFDQFCCKSNIRVNDTGCDDWKERGFASKSWIVFNHDSIYSYVK